MLNLHRLFYSNFEYLNIPGYCSLIRIYCIEEYLIYIYIYIYIKIKIHFISIIYSGSFQVF